jgi:hypothetical protein
MTAPARLVLGLLLPTALAGGLAACSSAPSAAPAGQCRPTVQGVAPEGFATAQAAVAAFARSSPDGAFRAVLEDVAWLRFEGDEEAVIKKHRAYFEQGYTTFSVTLMTKGFVQPTGEVFLLTDSLGAHLTGKPITYASTMGQEEERFAARFQVSFHHAISRDVEWVRLKRQADGHELEWVFPWAKKGTPGAAGASARATNDPGTPDPLAYERPENLWRARNTAPAAELDPRGRPRNLIASDAASPPTAPAPAATSVPAASAHAETWTPAPPAHAGGSVGEPLWSAPPPAPAPAGPVASTQLAAAPPPAPAAAPLPPPTPAPTTGALPPPAVRRK